MLEKKPWVLPTAIQFFHVMIIALRPVNSVYNTRIAIQIIGKAEESIIIIVIFLDYLPTLTSTVWPSFVAIIEEPFFFQEILS